jgi:hypothetical protein
VPEARGTPGNIQELRSKEIDDAKEEIGMSIMGLIEVMTEVSKEEDVVEVGKQIVAADKYVFDDFDQLPKCEGQLFLDTFNAIRDGKIKFPTANLLFSTDNKKGMFHLHAVYDWQNHHAWVCTMIIEDLRKKGTRYYFMPFQICCSFLDDGFSIEDWGPQKEKWSKKKHNKDSVATTAQMFLSCLAVLNRSDSQVIEMVEANSDLMVGEPLDKFVVVKKVVTK